MMVATAGNGRRINWNEIAKLIPGRNNKDCRKRYFNEVAGCLKKVSCVVLHSGVIYNHLDAIVAKYNFSVTDIALPPIGSLDGRRRPQAEELRTAVRTIMGGDCTKDAEP